jgi:hypothetical protein
MNSPTHRFISAFVFASYAMFASGLPPVLHAAQCSTDAHPHGSATSDAHSHAGHHHGHDHDHSPRPADSDSDCPTCYQIKSTSTAIAVETMPTVSLDEAARLVRVASGEVVPAARSHSPRASRAPPVI